MKARFINDNMHHYDSTLSMKIKALDIRLGHEVIPLATKKPFFAGMKNQLDLTVNGILLWLV